MDLGPDELAGIVDLFGALTPAELRRAVDEVAFRRGESVEDEAFETMLEEATASYRLVEATREGDRLLLAGPAAFPQIPEHGSDLPHIMDLPRRTVDRDAVAEGIRSDLISSAATAPDPGTAASLRELSYDLEAWADVDGTAIRSRLEAGEADGNAVGDDGDHEDDGTHAAEDDVSTEDGAEPADGDDVSTEDGEEPADGES